MSELTSNALPSNSAENMEMTDEQIDALADANYMGTIRYENDPVRYWRAFARAILAARAQPAPSGDAGAPSTSADQRQVRKDSQGLGEPGRLSPTKASSEATCSALGDRCEWPHTCEERGSCAYGVRVPDLPQQWATMIEEAVDAFSEGNPLGDRLPNAMAALRDALAYGVNPSGEKQ